MDEAGYSLFQEEVLNRLRERAWFIPSISYNILFVARSYGCHVKVSELRTGEAFDYWVEDSNRTLSHGMPPGTGTLDHFKEAAFLAFWLRRRLPINEITKLQSLGERAAGLGTQEQKMFLRYGNEISAFTIGYKLCLHHHLSVIETDGTVPSLRAPAALSSYVQANLNKTLLSDIVTMMKHKNVSPHGLYLLMRSLFR